MWVHVWVRVCVCACAHARVCPTITQLLDLVALHTKKNINKEQILTTNKYQQENCLSCFCTVLALAECRLEIETRMRSNGFVTLCSYSIGNVYGTGLPSYVVRDVTR